jgi:excisionase family DNA binding protein
MTIPATAKSLSHRLPSTDERASANNLRKIIASQGASEAKLKVHLETGLAEIVLAPALSGVLMELLRYIGNGDAVTLVPVSKMLTTQQAADILNVSRPFLVDLLENEAIPHTKVGRHRRIKADDLFAFKAKRDSDRSAALSDLAEMDAELL